MASESVNGACPGQSHRSLSLRTRVCHSNTRVYVRLLGPCFKTGHLKPFRQHPKRSSVQSTPAPKNHSKSGKPVVPRPRSPTHKSQNALPASIQPAVSTVTITHTPKSVTPFTVILRQAKLMLTWHGQIHAQPKLNVECPQPSLASNVSPLTISRAI